MPDDTKPLRAVLRKAIAASRMGRREIETALGIGHGKLDRLFDGRLEVRVRHVLALARLLEVSPNEFLEIAYPPPPGGPRFSLRDWFGPREAAPQGAQNKSGTAELREAVREILREELALFKEELTGARSKTSA